MSINRIRGDGGVIIDSKAFLELPKAPTIVTADQMRTGMIRYNTEWKAFEGVLEFEDGSVAYRRFANLDANGKLLSSQLPDSVTSGLQFLGTYDAIEDDTNPPASYAALPAPSVSLNGDYYVVRGIMDAAQEHYTQNTPTTSPVKFTPVNPTGQGDWIEILYYIDQNPIEPTKKLVSYAFARIVTTAIPASGHEGLVNLAQDESITTPFDTSLTPQGQTALADSDWIIITETKNIRLRQSRASISASSVLYDNTIMVGSQRQFSTNAGTVQTTLDNLVLEGLRRTGDSMVDDGLIGKGRLGVTYGSATEPAIGFNNAPYDPNTNPGNDPSKWTDTKTGIFHPADAAIGLTTAGVERVRVTNGSLNLYQSTTTPASAPTLRFANASNTNVGISGENNILSFSSMNKVQVEMQNGVTKLHGNLEVDGISTLTGDVTAVSNVTTNGNLNVKKDTTLGTGSSTNLLTVNSVSTFNKETSFNNVNNNFNGILLTSGNSFRFAHVTNDINMKLLNGELRMDVRGYADLSVYDSNVLRTRINRYGIQLPVLTTVNDSEGVDGMIAYSEQNRTSMQKIDGKWVPIGSSTVRTTLFTVDNWVLDGAYYRLTVPETDIVNAEIQEQVATDEFVKVDVDSVKFTLTGVVYSIPSSPDVRFAGRTLVTVK